MPVAVLDAAAAADATLEVRFAALVHDLGKGVTPAAHWPKHHDHERLGVPPVKAICARRRVPAACRDLALIVCQEHTLVHGVARLQAATIVRLLSRMGALRRPERLDAVLLACACDARGRLGFEHQAYPQAERLLAALTAIGQVKAGDLARAGKSPTQIAERLHVARVGAVIHLMRHEHVVARCDELWRRLASAYAKVSFEGDLLATHG